MGEGGRGEEVEAQGNWMGHRGGSVGGGMRNRDRVGVGGGAGVGE